ncbi:3934_t:CDS:1 [Paraglomus occultum]|uniref:SWI5-dependent HO expression protein 3 n=1 Tax=Paraglomus occultum TaxID=144539 RepID=A0A9N8Z164_9GLOM|nr:3934_t:CDS:1 [Paraglomus occultum]
MNEISCLPYPTEDPTKVHALRQQVDTLRADLAEKNALIASVQKHVNRQHPVPPSMESTTGRVIERLQLEIDSLKKELSDSKSQLQVARVARERAERQVQEHAQSHQSFLLELDSLKRILERKERQVKELEHSIKESDQKSMDMKFDRDNANTKLRQTELKVSDLERKIHEALAAKEQAEHEYSLLTKEMQSFKRRYQEDVDTVRHEFDELRDQLKSISHSLEDTILMTGVQVEELTTGRKNEVLELEQLQEKLKENQENYAKQFLLEIEKMKTDVEKNTRSTDEFYQEVIKMRSEITGKLNWFTKVEKARII